MKKKVFKIIGAIILGLLYIFLVNMIIYQIDEYCTIVGNNKEEDYKELVEKIIIKEDINIEYKDANDYIQFKDLEIRNDFKNFKQYYEDENSVSYEYNDIKNSRAIYFEIKVNDSLVNGSYSSTFLEEYNIKNDIDYIKVLKEYKYFKTKTNYSKLEYNEEARRGAEYYALENGYYNKLIGNQSGLIKHDINENETTVYIYHNDKTYELDFVGTEYFSDSNIYDLISTIKIGG